MESKKSLRRAIIWKRSNRSKRIQWKRDANNNNNAEMGSSSKPLFLISTVSLVCRSWGRICFDHLLGEDGDNSLDFTILNCDCCRRLFGFKVTLFKKSFLMKFLRGVMDMYRRDDNDDDDDDDDDDEDGIRVTLITRMAFPSGLLQLILYLAESFSQRIVMCVSSYLELICGCTAMLLGLTP